MDALLVFPYFLAKLLTHLGAESGVAVWLGAVLSSVCVVMTMMAPFHPRDGFKISMVGVSWVIIVMAAVGCVWECKEAQAGAESRSRAVPEWPLETAVPMRVVNLGEA